MTRILQMFADGSADLSDDAYDSMEAETRAAIVDLFVRTACKLVFSQAASEHNHPTEDRYLYLGSHQCSERMVDEPDSIYVELWAWIDEDDGSDFVTWNITTTDSEIKHPIHYCPFCGENLATETLND